MTAPVTKPLPGSEDEATAVDVWVGRQIRFARIARNISQEALGKRLGMSFQQIQKYEKGSNRVSCGRLFQIAVFLGKPVEWFFPDEQVDLDDGEDIVTQMLALPHGLEIARAFPRLDGRDRGMVADLAARLAPANGKANGHG